MPINNIVNFLIMNNDKSGLIDNLVSVLKENNMLYALPGIINKLKKTAISQENRGSLIVRTTYPLSQDNRDLIENKFKKKINKEIIDPSLLAGLIANDDKGILDISMKTLLTKLK